MGITDTEKIYEGLGISREVWEYGQRTESRLKERFEEFDKNAEYNQMKVIRAMQENRVSEGCFNYVSGYGYNDLGRDTLESVMRRYFIPRQPWYVHRLPVERMHWHWHWLPICVRAMNCSLRSESRMIHWKK